ncbi:MAG: protein translocase subunit SecD [Gemmatimonadota bacterium]|nr:protein translocase subunit SecD [Gemmatimonadota bacterium]MDH5550175.1 protein translocase subunit SecD [Gemmatimonadota bacterium]
MFSTIRSRLILIGVLVVASIISLVPREVTVRERSPDGRMRDVTIKRVPLKRGLDLMGGIHLALEVDQSKGVVANPEDALERALTVIRSRVDEFGVAEPLIQKVGNDRIVVELAGITDPGRAKQIVERSAFLEWRLTDMDNLFRDALPAIDRALTEAGVRIGPSVRDTAAQPSTLEQLLGADTTAGADSAAPDTAQTGLDRPGPLSSLLFAGQMEGEFLVPEEDFPRADSLISLPAVQRLIPRGRELVWGSEPRSAGGRSYRPLYSLERRSILTGEQLQDARATIDQTNNQSIATFTLTRAGGRRFRQETRQHVGDYMAIMLDGRVFRQPPVLRSEIGRNGQIELGNASLQEAQDLALVLRAGALPAPLVIVEERTVGPSLGRDSIRQGAQAGVVAGLLVILVMVGYYRFAGLLSVFALGFFALFTVGGLASFGATLTLPGLAGFVLSLGMAVDANVLIFERIREEVKQNKTPRLAVDAGFQNAMPAIIDANVTTVISAAFLFQFGTGPVKGFAVTLLVGIIASLITAVFVTKTFFLIWLQRRGATKELAI